MRKWDKKKILLGIAGLLVILIAAFYIFTNFVYLPGVHIWWRFCSVNIEKNCYWYDEGAGEFTGEFSAIKIKVTGFDWPSWLSFMYKNSNLKGMVEIADYPIWSEGHDAHLIYDHHYYGYASLIYVLEYYTKFDEANRLHPEFGEKYFVYFLDCPVIPEYVYVQVVEEREANSGPVIGGDREGYVANSLEEAKQMQEYMQKYGISKKP